MSDRELILEVTNNMPETATVTEVFDAVVVKLSAIKGFEDIDKGNSVTQEELLEEMKKW